MQRRTALLIGCGLSCLIWAASALAIDPDYRPPRHRDATNPPANGPQFTPLPSTIDQITHNGGNIVTTINNYGLIGGYDFAGLPSGEYPRNSGRNYIAEIVYWFGGVTPGGDTLVADTYDDFQGLPSLVSGSASNTILLSTDTTRYFDYSTSDTVGSGFSNPAFGWRIWDADSNNWIYQPNYLPNDSTFVPGGPLAVQQSHYRFNDAALGSSLLGLELTQTVLQWNFCYNEDITFVLLDITNKSGVDYTNFSFGLYVDLDLGGQDGTGENGRLNDQVGYDSAANLAWNYDLDRDPGWGVVPKLMGTKYLETPNDIGMTGLRNEDWALIPRDDPSRFVFMSQVGYDPLLPPTDQIYMQTTSGIDIANDSTIRVVFAIIAGDTETDLRTNGDLAQTLYDNFYVGPRPPITPTLTATPGDERVYLFWNDTAETSVDPLSGDMDFAGYKLYRSDDQGRTWGEEDRTSENSCLEIEYDRVAEFQTAVPGAPIAHSFVDSGLYNGVEYWYALVAYDTGAADNGVDVLQNGFGIAGEQSNIVKVTPRTDPVGFFQAAGTVVHEYDGFRDRSEGSVTPIVFDRDSVVSDARYAVTFEDFADRPTEWHLVNTTSGDTVLANQTDYTSDPGEYPLVNGLRVVVRSADRLPTRAEQTTIGGNGENLVIGQFFQPTIAELTANPINTFGDAQYRHDYELRYTGDTTVAASVLEGFVGPEPLYTLPFEVWNTTTNQRVSAAVYDLEFDGVWNFAPAWGLMDVISIVNIPYDENRNLTQDAFPFFYGWFFSFGPQFNPAVGDVFTIEGASMNSPDDRFVFRADGVDADQARQNLDEVRVVPNPYVARYSALVETSDRAVLEFQRVPDECTIRIYTLAGDLVIELRNTDGDGVVRWDLLSRTGRQVASGLYLYHVESPYGEQLGRFAVIK